MVKQIGTSVLWNTTQQFKKEQTINIHDNLDGLQGNQAEFVGIFFKSVSRDYIFYDSIYKTF